MTFRALAAATTVGMVFVLGGCGGAPTAAPAENDTASSSSGGTGAEMLDKVYAEVDGLTGKEREDKLLELAKQEEGNGDFTIYYGIDEAEEWVSAFEEKYGIPVKYITASSRDLILRVTQEAAANYDNAADVVMSNQMEMTELALKNKVFLPLKTPTSDVLPDNLVHEDRVSYIENWFAVTWNPNLIKDGDVPKTWDDLFTKYADRMIIDTTDVEWFATLVEGYFVGELGMTEDEAVEKFKQMARGSAGIAGHTLMTQLIGQGEYAISPDAYANRVQQLVRDDGIPLAWEPPVEPIISRVDEVAINNLTDRPATALLWIDFVLTDVQTEHMPKQDLEPITESGNAPYKVMYEDAVDLVNNSEKWNRLWSEVTAQVGKTVTE